MILGASSDIGCAFIERYHDKYDHIIAHYNSNQTRIDGLAAKTGQKLIPLQADLSEKESIERFINSIISQNIYPDKILHLAASKIRSVRYSQCTDKIFYDEMKCSLLAFVDIVGAFIPCMAKRKYGSIVVMLSSVTDGEVPKFMSPYVVSKYALLGLVKALSAEYAVKGINVNAVSPEMIDTQFISEMPEMFVELNRENSVAGRNLNINEIIPSLDYLLSDGARMITGQNIVISGVKR